MNRLSPPRHPSVGRYPTTESTGCPRRATGRDTPRRRRGPAATSASTPADPGADPGGPRRGGRRSPARHPTVPSTGGPARGGGRTPARRRTDPTSTSAAAAADCATAAGGGQILYGVIGRFYYVAVTGTRLVLPVLVHKDTQIIIGPGRPRDSGRPPATSAEPPTSTGLRPDGGDVRGAPAGRRRRPRGSGRPAAMSGQLILPQNTWHPKSIIGCL